MKIVDFVDEIKKTEDDFVIVSFKTSAVTSSRNMELIKNFSGNVFITVRNIGLDDSDSNILLFDVKGYISLAEFLNQHVFSEKQLKLMTLQLLSTVIELDQSALTSSGLLLDEKYIFVNRITGDVRYIYLPVEALIPPSEAMPAFRLLLKKFLFRSKTDQYYTLSGFLLGQLNTNENFNLQRLYEELEQYELQTEVVKPKSHMVHTYPAVGTVALISIALPLFLSFVFRNLNVILALFLGLGNALLSGVALILNEKATNHRIIKNEKESGNCSSKAEESKSENAPVNSDEEEHKPCDAGENSGHEQKNSPAINKHSHEYVPIVDRSADDVKIQQAAAQEESDQYDHDQLIPSDTETLFDSTFFNAYVLKKSGTENCKIYLDFNDFFIGSDSGCNLIVNKSSLNHAKIIHYDGKYSLVDLGSEQGTCLNGIKIIPQNEYSLGAGDIITIGQNQFVFQN